MKRVQQQPRARLQSKLNSQPLLLLWWFPGSSSRHRDPETRQRSRRASRSQPPPEPAATDRHAKVKHTCRGPGEGSLHHSPHQAFTGFALEGQRPPPYESNLGEEVALQHLLKQQAARFTGGTEDEAASILPPEVLLQGRHVLGHAGRNQELAKHVSHEMGGIHKNEHYEASAPWQVLASLANVSHIYKGTDVSSYVCLRPRARSFN